MIPDYCNTCSGLFRKMASCPNPAILHGDDTFQSILEYIWAFASVLPLFINVGQLLYLFASRSSRTIFMVIAMVLHGMINEKGLKRWLAESRPYGSCASGYGLPSGHSGFAIGLAAYLVLEMVLLHDKVPFKKGFGYKFMTISYLIVAPLIPISRVFLNYHSVKQIIWGSIVGIALYSLFFYMMLAIVNKNEGKFWSGLTRGLRRRGIMQENILGFVGENGEILMNDVKKTPNQEDGEEKEMKIVLPLKDNVKDSLWKKVDYNEGSHNESVDLGKIF